MQGREEAEIIILEYRVLSYLIACSLSGFGSKSSLDEKFIGNIAGIDKIGCVNRFGIFETITSVKIACPPISRIIIIKTIIGIFVRITVFVSCFQAPSP